MADKFYTIRGEAYYAKVLGNPVDNYNRDGKEWTIELKPDKNAIKVLKELKLDSRITKGENKDRILFRQKEKRPSGELNRRISVFDANDKPWPVDKLIGNGSIVDLKFKFTDYGKGKIPGVYPQAIRVLEYIEYVRQEFAPLTEEDKYWKAPVAHEANDFHEDFDIEQPAEEDDIP